MDKIQEQINQLSGAKSDIQGLYETVKSDIDEPIRHVLVGVSTDSCDDTVAVLAQSKHKLFIIDNHWIFQTISKKDIESADFIKSKPDGAFSITVNGKLQTFAKINADGIAVFVQDLKPKAVYKAKYDNTQRFQNDFLTNVEHAKEIDDVRYKMQMGQISQHDYDSINPTLPKAGK